jgi:hypothetical protein
MLRGWVSKQLCLAFSTAAHLLDRLKALLLLHFYY